VRVCGHLVPVFGTGIAEQAFLGRAASSRKTTPAFADCACGWRTYRQAANENPVAVRSSSVASWVLPERCSSCGEPLVVELDRLDPKPFS
jgi:hypothetical protein